MSAYLKSIWKEFLTISVLILRKDILIHYLISYLYFYYYLLLPLMFKSNCRLNDNTFLPIFSVFFGHFNTQNFLLNSH